MKITKHKKIQCNTNRYIKSNKYNSTLDDTMYEIITEDILPHTRLANIDPNVEIDGSTFSFEYVGANRVPYLQYDIEFTFEMDAEGAYDFMDFDEFGNLKNVSDSLPVFLDESRLYYVHSIIHVEDGKIDVEIDDVCAEGSDYYSTLIRQNINEDLLMDYITVVALPAVKEIEKTLSSYRPKDDDWYLN